MDPTLYDILGVSPDAAQDDIHTVYARHLQAGTATTNIQHAYSILGDVERRQAYDQWLAAQAATEPRRHLLVADPDATGEPISLPTPPASASDDGAEVEDNYEYGDETWHRKQERWARGYPMPQARDLLRPFQRKSGGIRRLGSASDQLEVLAEDLKAGIRELGPRLRELMHLKKLWTIVVAAAVIGSLPQIVLREGVPGWITIAALAAVGAALGYLRRRALGVTGAVINVAYPAAGALLALAALAAAQPVGAPLTGLVYSGPIAWAIAAAVFIGYRFICSSRYHNGTLWARILTGPKPGEIWWAWVAYSNGVDEYGNTGKERPVFVMWVSREKFGKRWYTVAPITSQVKRRGQPGYLEISRRRWNRAGIFRAGVSFLNFGDLRKLTRANFTKRLGKPAAVDRRRIKQVLPHPEALHWEPL